MNRKLILTFLAGLVLGAVAMLILQPILGDSLPQAVRGKREAVSGPVTAKRLEAAKLLLTIVTPEGATLATFTKRLSEIDLLVEPGDTVTLTLSEYQPFLSDPEITRVVKPSGAGTIVGEAAAAADSIQPGVRRPPQDTAGRRPPLEPVDTLPEAVDTTGQSG